MKSYKYYDLILGAYVCVLLCSNLIGPAKVSIDRDTDFTPFSLSTSPSRQVFATPLEG